MRFSSASEKAVGTGDHAIHREPPIGKTAGQEALVRLGLGRIAADGNHLGDFAAIEFAGQ